ncbi:MAG: heavy-metal-associated domain-containing protein [Candidatus Micrarchaeota archaeon]
MIKEHKMELKGMTCGACETLITRVITQNEGQVANIDIKNGQVTLFCEDDKLGLIKQNLSEKGFHEKNQEFMEEEQRGDHRRVVKYLLNILGKKPQAEVESTLLEYVIGSASAILILGFAAYLAFPAFINFALQYLPLLVLLFTGVLMLLFSYYHIRCYRKSLSCANGMMVGMTIGMMSGFLAGAIVGATNGMFIGSVVGMALGILPGFALGRYCGIMGAMEGIMAGIMAGTMGAMLSVMMVNDNLILFLYLLFGLCAVMLGGLSYMMHREAGPAQLKEMNVKFSEFALLAVAVSLLVLEIMLYGPKNGIIYL